MTVRKGKQRLEQLGAVKQMTVPQYFKQLNRMKRYYARISGLSRGHSGSVQNVKISNTYNRATTEFNRRLYESDTSRIRTNCTNPAYNKVFKDQLANLASSHL